MFKVNTIFQLWIKVFNPVQTFNKSDNDEICGKKFGAAVPVKNLKFDNTKKVEKWVYGNNV